MDVWLTDVLSAHGVTILYAGTLTLLLLCGVGVPIPEELTFLAAGYAAAKLPESNLWVLCLIGLVGIVAGDSVPFVLGRRYGLDIFGHRWLAKLLPQKRIEKGQEFFRKHGAKTVFCARFVAGARMPTFFLAGSMGVRYWTFFMWDLVGALISCPTSIVLAYHFGPKAEELLAEYKWYVLGGIVAIAALAAVVRLLWRRGDPPATAAPPAPSEASAEGRK